MDPQAGDVVRLKCDSTLMFALSGNPGKPGGHATLECIWMDNVGGIKTAHIPVIALEVIGNEPSRKSR